MSVSCLVKTCKNNRSQKIEGISFHNVPKCYTQRKPWIEILCLNEDFIWSRNRVVCSDHFVDEDFVVYYGKEPFRRLKKGSIPSLFLNDTVNSSNVSTCEFSGQTSPERTSSEKYSSSISFEETMDIKLEENEVDTYELTGELMNAIETETAERLKQTQGKHNSPNCFEDMIDIKTEEFEEDNYDIIEESLNEMKSEAEELLPKLLKNDKNDGKYKLPERGRLKVKLENNEGDFDDVSNMRNEIEIGEISFLEGNRFVKSVECLVSFESHLAGLSPNKNSSEEKRGVRGDDNVNKNGFSSDEDEECHETNRAPREENDMEDAALKSQTSQRPKCQFCDFIARDSVVLNCHINAVHLNPLTFKCENCDFITATYDSLERHVHSVHPEIRNCSKKGRCHKCDLCDYSAPGSSALKRHMNDVHFKLKNFKCNLCTYSSTRAGHLKSHINAVHRNIRNYKCDYCDYTSCRSSNLRVHMSTAHNKGNDYKCDECSYSSRQSGHLKRHINNFHRNVVKVCELCDYSTTDSWFLKVHVSIHH